MPVGWYMKKYILLAVTACLVLSCGSDGLTYYYERDARIEARQGGKYIDIYAPNPPLVSGGQILEFHGYSNGIIVDLMTKCEWKVVCGDWIHFDEEQRGHCNAYWTVISAPGSVDVCSVSLTVKRDSLANESSYKGETKGRFRFDNR